MPKYSRRSAPILMAAAVVAGALVAGPPAAAGIAAPATRASTQSLTLITGDRVEVTTLPNGRRIVRSSAGPGRKAAFVEHETRGRLTVIPADAIPLIAAGRLDPRLFDVTTQLEQKRDATNLIVRYDRPSQARTRLAAAGADVVRNLPALGGAAIQVRAGALWSELNPSSRSLGGGFAKIWLNGLRKPALDRSTAQIGAPAVWAAGFTGAGVPIAVVDTGIDTTHPDLAGQVTTARDFTGTGPGDQVGHGTHVASTAAGTGAGAAGKYKGVAHGAKLIDAKVCTPGGCSEADILAAMEWATVEQRARVVNLSLGAPDTAGIDPIEQAVETLSGRTGALFVVAAGNNGPAPSTLGTPGTAGSALTVGAVDADDQLAGFSSRGPRLGDGAMKPEIVAPGVGIVAAHAAGTEAAQIVDGRYVRMSGTSMAAPHVAGAAAILAEKHPTWKGPELKAALIASAKQVGGSVFEVGGGRVDVDTASRQQVLTSPATLSLGVAAWPHDDDEPMVGKISYRNTGSTAVTLDLTAVGEGPNGTAPTGMFSVSPARLPVAAGESATATVTVTTQEGVDGNYSGRIEARSGSAVVTRTPVGVIKEVESATVTLNVVDRAGRPCDSIVLLTDLATGRREILVLGPGPSRRRLPVGRYDVQSVVRTVDGEQTRNISLVARPGMTVATDTTVVLDARKAKTVGATAVDAKNAAPVVRRTGIVTTAGSIMTGTDYDGIGVEVTPTGPVDYPYHYRQDVSLTQPAGTREPKGYNLYFGIDGRIPLPVFEVRDADLGRVRSVAYTEGTGTIPPTLSFDSAFGPVDPVARPMGYDVTGPGVRYDFYTAGNGVQWEARARLSEERIEFGRPLDLRPGDRVNESWNLAALRPRLFPRMLAGKVFEVGLWTSSPAAVQHYGTDFADTVTGRTSLSRNGQPIGVVESPAGGSFDLPDGRAHYVLTSDITRSLSWSKLSTRLVSKWSFTIDPAVEGDAPAVNLRINAPGADLHNRLRRGPGNQVVLTPEPTRGDVKADSARLAVSYDDGNTWHGVPTTRHGEQFVAVLPQAPAGAAAASLRASATDAEGNEVEHEIIRAYTLR